MDSYEILNVTRESTDKEIETSYNDLKRKYDPSFNTSIHAYKKYREIIKAYENIKDEQRRKMYNLEDNDSLKEKKEEAYDLYDFFSKEEVNVETKNIDYNKAEDLSASSYKDIEISIKLSYLYKLLNLRYELEYFHKVKCDSCEDFVTCPTCNGDKVVEYKEHMIWCPVCRGEGKVSVNCKKCGGSGYHLTKDKLAFYVEDSFNEFKGYGDDYGNNLKSNLKVTFDFYDKDNIKINGDVIEVDYHLTKEETLFGFNQEYFSEFGAFKLQVPSFVEDGYVEQFDFNNKKIVFKFYNDKYDGEDKQMYLFINKKYKNKIIYFDNDYSLCNFEETPECPNMVKCTSKIEIEGKGKDGKYGGRNGNLIVSVEFNGEDELVYTENVKVLNTSKLFNMLGGKVDDIYHYGFKGSNSLIKKDDGYYLLKGNNEEKTKLKNYFLFKVFSVLFWFMIPLLMLVIPYTQTMFIVLISVLVVYLVLINLIMEVEA